jgi:uncharacterized paraquat-inducible protein A
MIRVSLSLLIFIYLFLFLTVVFGQWLWNDLRRKRREKHALRHRLRCTMCSCDFEDATDEVLPRCPCCGALNERFRPGML